MAFSTNTEFHSTSKNNSALVCSDTHSSSPQAGANTEVWLLRLLFRFPSVSGAGAQRWQGVVRSLRGGSCGEVSEGRELGGGHLRRAVRGSLTGISEVREL